MEVIQNWGEEFKIRLYKVIRNNMQKVYIILFRPLDDPKNTTMG